MWVHHHGNINTFPKLKGKRLSFGWLIVLGVLFVFFFCGLVFLIH